MGRFRLSLKIYCKLFKILIVLEINHTKMKMNFCVWVSSLTFSLNQSCEK